MKEYFFIAYKNSKNNKVRKNIFIFIISLFLLIILIPWAIYKTYDNAIDLVNNMSDSKTITIRNVTDSEKEFLANYQNEHIIKIDYSYTLVSGVLDNLDEYSHIYLYENIDEYIPKIIKGNNELEDYEMLCPSNMYYKKFSGVLYSDLTKVKIGDNYNLDFYKFLGLDENNEPIYEITPKTLTVKSLYNADLTYSYDTCYVNSKTYEELKELTIGVDGTSTIQIYIDTVENAQIIAQDLNNNNIYVSLPTADADFMKPLLLLCLVLVIFMSIASLVVIVIYISNYFKNDYKHLALYKALGYNKKEISIIMWFELFILIITCFIIDFILYLVLSNTIELVLKRIVDYRTIEIEMPILPLLIYFIIIILFSFVFILNDSYKIDKLTVRELQE